jgi:DNA mismatch endonuclease Vsr
VDRVSKVTRSIIMGKIRKRNSVPEVTLRKAPWEHGIRGWRLYRQDLPGNPDLAFSRQWLAVFVDGCFWHRCPRCFRRPHTRLRYWDAKIEGNVVRDRTQKARLRRQGWRVLRFWEHELLFNPARCAEEVGRMLQ